MHLQAKLTGLVHFFRVHLDLVGCRMQAAAQAAAGRQQQAAQPASGLAWRCVIHQGHIFPQSIAVSDSSLPGARRIKHSSAPPFSLQ
jgi:hypothetical protein